MGFLEMRALLRELDELVWHIAYQLGITENELSDQLQAVEPDIWKLHEDEEEKVQALIDKLRFVENTLFHQDWADAKKHFRAGVSPVASALADYPPRSTAPGQQG